MERKAEDMARTDTLVRKEKWKWSSLSKEKQEAQPPPPPSAREAFFGLLSIVPRSKENASA